MLSKIDPIPWAEIEAEFLQARFIAHTVTVAEISFFHAADASENAIAHRLIAKIAQKFPELVSLASLFAHLAVCILWDTLRQARV